MITNIKVNELEKVLVTLPENEDEVIDYLLYVTPNNFLQLSKLVTNTDFSVDVDYSGFDY